MVLTAVGRERLIISDIDSEMYLGQHVLETEVKKGTLCGLYIANLTLYLISWLISTVYFFFSLNIYFEVYPDDCVCREVIDDQRMFE